PARGVDRTRPEGDRDPRSAVLQVDLLSRAGRRADRGCDHGAGLHGGRTARPAWPRSEAAAVGRAASRGNRSRPRGRHLSRGGMSDLPIACTLTAEALAERRAGLLATL